MFDMLPSAIATAPASLRLHSSPRPSAPTRDRALAFVDIETTGFDPVGHEIVELAVVLVDSTSLEVIHEYATRVVPTRLETADEEALAICGFTEAGWVTAMPLRDALRTVAPLLEGALLAGHGVGFDASFLDEGFRRTGVIPPRMDYHRLDTASLAWPLVVSGEIESLSLDAVAAHFGVTRPRPHRALADARCSLAVARRLAERMREGGRLLRLEGDERAIAGALVERLDRGRSQYGRWRVDDGRDYRAEVFEEVLDGLHYCAAELVRLEKLASSRRPRIYVCHPFSDDPVGNIAKVGAIARGLFDEGLMPVAPHLYLPSIVSEEDEREAAMQLCLELVETADELRVFGCVITAGMEREIAHARSRGIPVRFDVAVFA